MNRRSDSMAPVRVGIARPGAVLLLGMVLALALPAASAGPQDYVITRGPIGTNYAYNWRLCVVDKNEFMSPVILSSKLVVQRYKNGTTSPWGTNTSFPAPPSFAYPDIARDPATGTVYVSFVTAALDQIFTYKRAPADADWVLVAALDKPSANNIGTTTRLSFNASTGTLFLAFSEVTSTKVYLYELVSGSWVDRTGAASMSCYNEWIDLVSYGGKVIVTTTPNVSGKDTLRVHVWNTLTSTFTNLPDWNAGVNGFSVRWGSTAYNSAADEYVAFFGHKPSSSWGPKAMRSTAGGAWTDISTGLSGIVVNSNWTGHVVYNATMARYSLVFSDNTSSPSTVKGYTLNDTTWASFAPPPALKSTNTFAIADYKDVYFLALAEENYVGIYSVNETPTRNTVDITPTPGTTTCQLSYPARGVGHRVAVFLKAAPTYTAPVPADGTTYAASPAFGSGAQVGTSGWYCVYDGIGETVTVTGLTSGTTYQVQAFEYNGVAAAEMEMYWTGGSVSGNPTSFWTTAACANPTSAGTVSAAQAICSGSSPTAFASTASPTGHTGTLEYKWQSSTVSSSTGFSDIPSSNSDGYAPGPVSVATWFKRLARVTCTADWTGAAESNVVAITVSPAGQVNQPANQVAFNGSATTAIAFATTSTGGTTTYAWTNSAPSIGLAASGTGNIPSFTAVSTGTSQVVATVTVTPTFTAGGSACTGPAKTFTITVGQRPEVPAMNGWGMALYVLLIGGAALFAMRKVLG